MQMQEAFCAYVEPQSGLVVDLAGPDVCPIRLKALEEG